MNYIKHDFQSKEKLYAFQLNEMDTQIYNNTEAIRALLEKENPDTPNDGSYKYTYDGDNTSDAHVWVNNTNNARTFVKITNLTEQEIDWVGATVNVLVPEWPENNYSFVITKSMINDIGDFVQILYQDSKSNDQSDNAMIVICKYPGNYVTALNGWEATLEYKETGVYFLDNRASWGGKYVASVIKTANTETPEEKEEMDEESPIYYNGDEICVFAKGICIGDSITEGTFNSSNEQIVRKQYSYPRILQRMTGIEIINAGIGGLTASEWNAAAHDASLFGGSWNNNEWSWTSGFELSIDYSGYDFAIIHLGINDIYKNPTSPIEDIVSDFESGINNIINEIKISTDSKFKIFLCTIIPSYAVQGDANYEVLNMKIKEIADQNENVYLIDLNKYSECKQMTPYSYIHLTAIGYQKLAAEIKALISYTIKNNLDSFKEIQFIETGLTIN